jgi:hypothetical protein
MCRSPDNSCAVCVQCSMKFRFEKKTIIFIASDIQLLPIKIGPQHKKSVGRGNMHTYYRKHSIQSFQQQQQQI